MRPMQARLVRIATFFLRLSVRSWRLRVRYEEGRSVRPQDHSFGEELYAVRERDLVALAALGRFARFITLVARGSDGDWAAIVAEGLGCSVIRGSSLHDPTVSAMALTRAIRESHAPAFLVVDGPLGPPGVAKEGIAAIARITRRSIIPVSAEAGAKIVLQRTWSRMFIPLPFARVVVSFGDPIGIPADANRSDLTHAAGLVSSWYAAAVPA